MSRTHALMERMDMGMQVAALIKGALPDNGLDKALLSKAVVKAEVLESLLDRLHEEMLPKVVAQIYVFLATGTDVSDDETMRLTRIVADSFRQSEAAKRLASAA